MIITSRVLLCTLLVCIFIGLSTIVFAAPAPSAFGQYGIFGINMSPDAFTTGQLTYTVMLNSGAYLIVLW